MSLRSITFALPVLLAPAAAGAVPVTYTLATMDGFGSLGTATFSHAAVTFTATADTANLQEHFEVPGTGGRGSRIYENYSTIALTSLTVTVGSLPAATFSLPLQARYAYLDSIYFSNSSGQGYNGYDVPTLPSTPDILGGFTLAPLSLSNNPFVGMAATTQGSFSLEYNTIKPIIFTAMPAASVPEPASAALLAIGLLGQGYAVRRWRLVRRSQKPATARPGGGAAGLAGGPGSAGAGHHLPRHAA